MTLPRRIPKPLVPPIKTQGIKTKLVDFVASSIQWPAEGRWIEPFLGSGVVLFNINPSRALVNDANPHLIRFYQKLYRHTITPEQVETFLTKEGKILAEQGESYYYTVRERFNEYHDSLDFLFLNRSGFNGMMRFNSRGGFNVPFCRKPDRFRKAYVTKICNQVKAVQQVMQGKDWIFTALDWRACLNQAQKSDFVYLDPPYVGRHTDYFNQWSDEEAIDLARISQTLPCGVALSMWKKNKYRDNDHLATYWSGMVERTIGHFYHLGATENLRHEMIEALMITPGFATAPTKI